MPYPAQTPAGAPTCYRHPDRPTYVSCTRCGRPVCPDCMRNAAVGHQCVDCVQAAVASVPQVRTAAGAVVRTGLPVVSYGLIAVNVAVFLCRWHPRLVQYRFALWPGAVAAGGVLPPDHLGLHALRARAHPVQHVCALHARSAAGSGTWDGCGSPACIC